MYVAPGSAFGAYRIVAPLGRGGMASVYEAYEPDLDRHVALKVLPAEFLHEPTFSDRFRREARVVARLEHPNIIPVFAFGIHGDIPWMAMRLVRGGALSSLARGGNLDHDRVVAIVRGVAAALDYAHGEGVLHRDVKPQNILLDKQGHVFLADFGIAKMVEGSAVLTKTGMMTGTPQYMSPEQARGMPVDHRADIYALGVVAYELLAGAVPFVADTPVAVLLKHAMDPIPIPEGVPEPLVRVVLKCLSKDPAERWQTAGAFSGALDRAHSQAPTSTGTTRATLGGPATASAPLPKPSPLPPTPTITAVSGEPSIGSGNQASRTIPRRYRYLLALAATVLIVGAGVVVGRYTAREGQTAIQPPRGNNSTVESARGQRISEDAPGRYAASPTEPATQPLRRLHSILESAEDERASDDAQRAMLATRAVAFVQRHGSRILNEAYPLAFGRLRYHRTELLEVAAPADGYAVTVRLHYQNLLRDPHFVDITFHYDSFGERRSWEFSGYSDAIAPRELTLGTLLRLAQ